MKSTLASFLALLAAATAFAASPPPRFGSGPLTRSVQNESNAAIDRACGWIARLQQPDGHWGTNDEVRLTSLCLLALAGDGEERPPEEQATINRGVRWLLAPTSTNDLGSAPASLASRAWRDMALLFLAPAPLPADPVLSAPPPLTNAPAAEAVAIEWPIAEARRLRGLAVERPASTNEDPTARFIAEAQRGASPSALAKPIADLARAWDGAPGEFWLSDPAAGWWAARSINRALGGDLPLPAGQDGVVRLVMWRRTLAGDWIVSQRIDAFGNGFWPGPIERTAFAVLLLREL